MGSALPETSPYRAKYDGGESELGSFLAYMDNGFDRVGGEVKHATMVGDVVIGADDDGNGKHMYIRVEEHRSVFLTASHTHGVIAVRGFSIQNPLGVYRLRRGTAS
ncbi:MAG TPA: hypothetical protein EYQ82_01950 [Dehalococcoidia bacterium]|nr:hypothetical protein [Dehalococcoidia bacterium]